MGARGRTGEVTSTVNMCKSEDATVIADYNKATSTTTGTCDTHQCGHHLASLPGVPMKLSLVLAAILSTASSAFALDGTVNIHDPSTVIQSNGKWFTWGTGGGGLVSSDGWT